MSVLFAFGSLCFTVAALAAQWASVSRPGVGVTFFAGSIFFTCASYLQYSETVNVEHNISSQARRSLARVRGGRDRLAARARERRAAQRAPREWGHGRRRAVLPGGGAGADARGRRRGVRRNRSARCRECGIPTADLTARSDV
jgi:hypothetical protein